MSRHNSSVIVSAYNQSSTIGAICSALSKDARDSNIDVEIIIVDDGSAKQEVFNAMSILETYNAASACNIFYVWQQDIGFRLASSRNNGLRLARSNNIIFIDGDCVPNSGFLEAHINIISRQRDIVSIGHRNFQILTGGQVDIDLQTHLQIRERAEEDHIRKMCLTSQPWRAVHGRNFAYQRNDNKIFFDENLTAWGGEDTDYAISLFENGYVKYHYQKLASVTQFDDFTDSLNPYFSLKSEMVARTMANYLYLMKKNVNTPEVYQEIAKYLAKYSVPFVLVRGDLILDEDRKNKFFETNESYTYETARALYCESLLKLKKFFVGRPHTNWPAILKSSSSGLDDLSLAL